MAELYIEGIKSTAAQKWFGLQVAKDGLTLFDLLGLQEDDVDATTVKRQVTVRMARLREVEQAAAKASRSNYVRVAKELASTIQSAAGRLMDAEELGRYRQSLAKTRQRMFERTIAPAVSAGRQPSAQEMAAFMDVARQYRVDTSEAKRLIHRLTGIKTQKDRYTSYGVLSVAEDPASPTYFDLLCLDETVANEALIRSQVEAQTKRAEEVAAKFTEMDRKREAREFIDKTLAKVAETLLSRTARDTYKKEIMNLRRKKFQDAVRLAFGPGQAVDADHVIRLLSEAQKMRLSEDAARQVITEVTGFADYMSLLGKRQAPLLGHISPLKFDIRSPEDIRACKQTLLIRNQGGGELKGSVSSASSWILVEPVHIRTRGTQRLTLQVDAQRLPRGIPTAGQVHIETNGGSQIVCVEAILAGGELPETTKERVWGGLVYLMSVATVFIGPMVCVFVFQKKSRYLTNQAAQASVLGVFFLGYLVIGVLASAFLPCFFPESLYEVGLIVIPGIAGVCALLTFAGKKVKIPIVSDYAERFV